MARCTGETKIHMMELKQLYYFKIAAEFEHITKAANYLGLNQPALSRSMSELENELGVKLFEKKGRGIMLSADGKYFYTQVCEMFRVLDNAKEELKKHNAPARPVVINVASNTALYVSGLLGFLREKIPAAQIRYSTVKRRQLLELLKNREVDFIICSPILEPKYKIETMLLMEEKCPVIFPADHWLAKKDAVTLKELEKEPFITVSEGFGIRDTADGFFEMAGFTPNYIIETTDTVSARALVRDGYGITFTSYSTLQLTAGLAGNYILPKDPACIGTVSLSHLRDMEMTPECALVKESIIEYFALLSEKAKAACAHDPHM